MSGVKVPPTRPSRSRWVVPRGSTPTPRARSDDDLLLDVGGGDHQALARLYDHLGGLVRANIRRALHDTTRTGVVAEEAFFEVWRQAARFDPARAPAVIWILDIAHQLAAEHNRYDVSRANAEAEQARIGPPDPPTGHDRGRPTDSAGEGDDPRASLQPRGQRH